MSRQDLRNQLAESGGTAKLVVQALAATASTIAEQLDPAGLIGWACFAFSSWLLMDPAREVRDDPQV